MKKIINEKYIIRHKILATLEEKSLQFSKQEHVDYEDISLTSAGLAKMSSIKDSKILGINIEL
jgi:hypothetical protein